MNAEIGICQISQIKPNLLLMSIVCASTLHAEPQFCLGKEYPCQMPEPLPSRNVIWMTEMNFHLQALGETECPHRW